ncbi:hypothetical protein [Methyloprofundus sp.]|uniref:hypothetical protein n=1 Tax=Methyloprofundus sp. TaxID=2020875 RepID=UPI003D0D5AA3
MKNRLILVLLTLSLSACFSVPLEAPYGQDVKLLPAGTPVEVTKRYQKWYAIWGIFPLTMSDYPAEVIAREDLAEARIYTEDTIEDAFSGFVYVMLIPAGILPQSIVIEGNRRKYARPTKSVLENN